MKKETGDYMKMKSKSKKRVSKGKEKQPIRDRELIDRIKEYLFAINKRDWFLFVLGLNTGRRIGDLIGLKVKDIKNREYLYICEEKTNKTINIKITKISKEIQLYIKGMDNDDYLFQSRQNDRYGKVRNIGYKRAYQILKKVFNEFGLNDTATHTLRKTFGYWYYKLTGDIDGLRQIFNHSSTQVTQRYIGITQIEIDDKMDKVKF